MLKAIKKHLKPYKWLHHMISNKKLHADELWNSRLSFSQFGEDLVLESLFELRGINKGFYVEVGAFDPLLLSNTYFFYKKGWRGICIEPNPISIEKMKSRRPGDIHLNLAVSNHPGKAQFLCDEAKSGILDESSLVSGYKLNNSIWLKSSASDFLNSLFISSSCKAIFSNG